MDALLMFSDIITCGVSNDFSVHTIGTILYAPVIALVRGVFADRF